MIRPKLDERATADGSDGRRFCKTLRCCGCLVGWPSPVVAPAVVGRSPKTLGGTTP
jgi:hypothetical protein